LLTRFFRAQCDDDHWPKEKHAWFALPAAGRPPGYGQTACRARNYLIHVLDCGFGGIAFASIEANSREKLPPIARQRLPQPSKKNGSLPEDKLPLRLCWGCLPLAIPAAACLASGFRANTLMVGGFPRVRLRFFASVSGPQLV